MKNVSSYIVAVCFMLLSSVSFAQLKNEKTETAAVNGNCGMCKKRIEKAGNVKNEAQVVWDADSQRASIVFDAEKTTKEAVLKRIAAVGYDNEAFLAPDKAYGELPECCQYDREIKASKDKEGESTVEETKGQ